MLQPLLFIAFFVVFLWLCIITYLILKQQQYQNILMKSGDKKALPEILESIIQEAAIHKRAVHELGKRYDTIEKEGKYHIQKMGLLRFNPFKDTGGDQSFILTLVDAHDTGVIISGLYSRSGTRWYAKKVVKGKALEHDLSDEEKKALKLAQPISHQ